MKVAVKKPYKYIIKLSEDERQALKQLLRSGKTERRIADRARIILWADEGLTIDETTRRLGCNRQTVINWRKWFLERRSAGIPKALEDKPRSGRPRAFSPCAGSPGESYSLCLARRAGITFESPLDF